MIIKVLLLSFFIIKFSFVWPKIHHDNKYEILYKCERITCVITKTLSTRLLVDSKKQRRKEKNMVRKQYFFIPAMLFPTSI